MKKQKRASTFKPLSSSLLYLPLNIQSRVELWLTFKSLKPVSAISFRNPSKTARVFSWLDRANIKYTLDTKRPEIAYVSKDISLAREAMRIMWSKKLVDEIKKGELFGYPKKATKAYASREPMSTITPQSFPNYWFAYMRYSVRESYETEDSQVAKKWADCIRKDIPTLAAWFENAILASVVME